MFYKPLNNLYITKKKSTFLLNIFEQKDENMDKYCFDCGSKNPELISINNGIYICKKCGMEHMLFPGGTSILTKNDIKTLTDNEIKFLKYGGNRKLYEYILNKCPSLLTLPRKFLYNSHILNDYQKQLQILINNKESIKTKKELYKLKLQINPNYSSNDISSFINSSMKRFNTTKAYNINDSNYDDNTFNSKKIKYNLNNYKLDDDIQNYVFTQRTNNTHANTISNSNTLSYVSEKTYENTHDYLNKCLDNINTTNNKNKHFLKKSNIIYNKPKIANIINNLKNEKNIKNYRYNHSIDYFDNENINNNNYINNYYFLNNTIDHIDDHNHLFLKSKDDSFKKNEKTIFDTKIKNINQSLQENIININYNNNELTFNKGVASTNRNSKNTFKNLRFRYSVNFPKRRNSFFNNIEDKEIKEKSVHSERKIKEIIINKKISNFDDYEYSMNKLNRFKSGSILGSKKPIQVNLNINTFDRGHYNTYFDSNDSLDNNNNINKNEIKNIEAKNNKKIDIKNFKRKIRKYNTTNFIQNHFNINRNLKKKFQQSDLININNSFDNDEKNAKENNIEENNKEENNKEEDNKEENNKEEKIKENNNITFNNKIKKLNANNFFVSKNKWASKTMKKINYKNRINNTICISENNIKKSTTKDKNKSKNEQKKIIKNKETKKKSNQEESYQKSNVEQFQILPIKKCIKKIINNKKFNTIKEKKSIINEKSNLEKKKYLKGNYFYNKNEKRIFKLNTNTNININKDKKIKYIKDYLSNSTIELKIGETFKNSIRNKYKREKSYKKND